MQSLKQLGLRYWRYAEYLATYLLWERPRGLDFSMRAKSAGISLPGSHGYALTSKKALRNILSNVPHRGRSLIDIGSGKGGVICFGHELGLARCEGVEYEPFLHETASRNIARLGYGANVRSNQADARLFDRYAEFDIYFLFNPFDYDIYAEVLASIVRQNQAAASPSGDKLLICYGDANLAAIQGNPRFALLLEKQCPYRGNMFRIYRLQLA